MRHTPWIIVATLLVAQSAEPMLHAPSDEWVALPAPPTPARQVVAPGGGYSMRESDFVVGREVYLRSSKTRIGTIIGAKEHKSFPAGFPRRDMKAVLIRRIDGPESWVPVEGIARIYVTR